MPPAEADPRGTAEPPAALEPGAAVAPRAAVEPPDEVELWADLPDGLELRPSPIAGRGVFARLDLPEGTAVRGPLNHSCDPNVWFAGDVLVTRRPVAVGEELTYDYATGSSELVLYCHCETYRCRQLVAGDDWRIPQLQQRYAGHWAPSLQRSIEAAG